MFLLVGLLQWSITSLWFTTTSVQDHTKQEYAGSTFVETEKDRSSNDKKKLEVRTGLHIHESTLVSQWKRFALAATNLVPVTRINCGGGLKNYVDMAGNIWVSDQNLGYNMTGSTRSYANNTIYNATIDSHLYLTERTGVALHYKIPVPTFSSMYIVQLHFAELFWKQPLKRIFNISIESALVLFDYDIFVISGGWYHSSVLEFTTKVTLDGVLNIKMNRSIDRAKISAIEVFQIKPSIVPSTLRTFKPRKPQTTSFAQRLQQTGKWTEISKNAAIRQRHEACFVMVGNRAYLIGGRGKFEVNIYNPETNTWKNGTKPPVLLHHMQCVSVDEKIWIVSAWTGYYPAETNAEYIYIYDPRFDTWFTKPALPEHRRRGSAAVIFVEHLRRIYVSHGNRGGHETSTYTNATTLSWLDYYDINNEKWVTNLPNGMYPRDHTGGALVENGYRFCVSGGRDGGTIGWPTVPQTECYNLVTNKWEQEVNIPQVRAGSAYADTFCDGQKYLFVAGGEGSGRAWNLFDMFDGTKWYRLANLTIGRHGTGLAVDCSRRSVYIASGSAGEGGGPEIRSVEVFTWN